MVETLKFRFDYIMWYLFELNAHVTEWVGNAFTYASATVVALWTIIGPQLGYGNELAWWCFFFYFVGSIIWAIAGYYLNNPRLVWLNLYFVVLNLYGMISRI